MWQPISTAPKDEDSEEQGWVILFAGGRVQCGYWGPTYFGRDFAWIQYGYRGEYEPVYGEPTHWMPLPEPPQL